MDGDRRLLAILTDRGSPARRAVLHDSTRPLGQALCDGGGTSGPAGTGR